MAGCCLTDKDGVCSTSPAQPSFCPACAKKGKSVATVTVKSLVREHTHVDPTRPHWFCPTPDCVVVYYSGDRTFRKPDLKVRVGIKETADPIPLCYCFDYSRADIRRDIGALGRTKIPDEIRAEIEGGFCACEVKNPSGNCCLGDIIRAVKAAQVTDLTGSNKFETSDYKTGECVDAKKV